MNYLNPHIFPLLSTESTLGLKAAKVGDDRNASKEDHNTGVFSRLAPTTRPNGANNSVSENYQCCTRSVKFASLGQKIHVRPSTNVFETYSPEGSVVDTHVIEAELKKLPEESQLTIQDARCKVVQLINAEELKSKLNGTDLSKSQSDYPKVTFLGNAHYF